MSAKFRRFAGRSDEGTVLLLILGLVVVAALLVAVVTDVSALYLKRQELIAAADGAALAGAQAVDEESIYRNGLPASGPVPLDPVSAEQAVRDYLTDAGLLSARLEVTITTSTTTVSVVLRTRTDLPVASTVTAGASGTAAVSASATARTAVIP
ncbi:MAG: pilus assembly protein TadG-related protein [Actinomycetia bacterium]|nr:pilus assembly protein TadG-related protein [Actinomycetes bacterium]